MFDANVGQRAHRGRHGPEFIPALQALAQEIGAHERAESRSAAQFAAAALHDDVAPDYLFSVATCDAPAAAAVSPTALNSYLNIGVNGQLYGPSDVVSGHSLFTWLKCFQLFGPRPIVQQVVGGWQPAWQRLFTSVNADIRLDSNVTAVRMGDGALASSTTGSKPAVILSTGVEMPFDVVVITAPLDELKTPLPQVMGQPLGNFEDTPVATGSFSSADAAPETDFQNRIYANYRHPLVATITYDGFSNVS